MVAVTVDMEQIERQKEPRLEVEHPVESVSEIYTDNPHSDLVWVRRSLYYLFWKRGVSGQRG